MKKHLLSVFIILVLGSCSSTKKIKTDNGISEINYLDINGTKQYVLIRGENKDNPILLFLHGGPGASATALLRKYNSELEKYFTVVYWDQRNAGKSYQKDFPKTQIKVDLYNKDVDFLVSYLRKRFNKEKLFLVGHSWGARLGIYAIHRNPDHFMAYVGIGQELEAYRGEFLSYEYTLNKAKEKNHKKALRDLNESGAPQSGDFATMYKNGFWGLVKQKHWLLKLGGERYGRTNYSDWICNIWLSREYSLSDLLKYGKSSGFSAGNIIYDPDFNNYNIPEKYKEFEVPVFFISGAYDYNTPWTLVEEYHAEIKAPKKEFIKFKKSGHSPCFEEPERFNKEIVRILSVVKND
ncbi:alpha/beta fold hydrolase [Allomuricauda sp. SCSIO 65647]|uniref:alpha/beta fold hydrolase n=1 Tax=Allomuricauda sp. SCSIO 65647 TaxID=2908843 RepID=UPI001F22210D|nr:alpha/beta hydrolase [Muricauda sp. SCSIO 65647]UJH67797.1 alpha/beta hydrolase [Muricauda sp. SCSIO 65647]